MSDFGAYVRKARERRGIAANRLAEAIGHSPSWVSDLESGAKKGVQPPYEMERLRDALGVPMRELLIAAGYDLDDDECAVRREDEEEIIACLPLIDDLRLSILRETAETMARHGRDQ